jgi:histidine triad (HIT) family protein
MSQCIFCRIVERAIPSAIVFEDEDALAFSDVNPQAPVHVLVIPKRHVASAHELAQNDPALLGRLVAVCARVADLKSITQSGYRVVTNTGAHAGQTVFHLHWHVLGGRPMAWPPG